jgi:hypothetical protein
LPGFGLAQIADGSAVLGNHSLQVMEHSLQVMEHSLQVMEHSPQLTEHSPQVMEHSPQVMEHSPQVMEHSPQVMEHSSRRMEHKHSQTANSFPCPNLRQPDKNETDVLSTVADGGICQYERHWVGAARCAVRSSQRDDPASEYVAPPGLEFDLGCGSTNMPRLRRWGAMIIALDTATAILIAYLSVAAYKGLNLPFPIQAGEP